MDAREKLALTIWLKEAFSGGQRRVQDWPGYFAWYEEEAAKPDRSYADNSAIGSCVARAEKVLRLIEAAGFRLEPMN